MKYKEVVKCPSEFNKIIELVNSLPKNLDLIYWELKKNFDNETKSLSERQETDRQPQCDLVFLPDKFRKQIEQLFPKNIYCYVIGVFEIGFDEWTFENHTQLQPLEKLSELINLRNLLIHIAKSTKREFEGWQFFEQMTFQPLINFGLDKNECVKPYANPIVQVFERKNLTLKRIRQCPICKDIFWANRIDAPTCKNKRCSDNYNKTQSRIRKYENKLNDCLIELKDHQNKLEELRNYKSPVPGLVILQEKLIDEQKKKVEKMLRNIEKNKRLLENDLETKRRHFDSQINEKEGKK